MAHFVSRDGLGFSSREEELALINNRSSEYILFDYTLDELMPAMFNLYHPTDLRKLIRPIYNIHFFTQGDNLYICFKNFEFGSLEAISNLSEILKFDDINGAYFINCHFTADTVLDMPANMAKVRITAQGLEFLEALKEKSVFHKIKDLSLDVAVDVGKSLLTEFISRQLGIKG